MPGPGTVRQMTVRQTKVQPTQAHAHSLSWLPALYGPPRSSDDYITHSEKKITESE
jgi:hypothetical protein